MYIIVENSGTKESSVLFAGAELLYVDSVLHFKAAHYRRLVVLLTAAQLLNYAGFLKFALEFLQCSLDVFSFFYGYFILFICLLFVFSNPASAPVLPRWGTTVQSPKALFRLQK